jgi:hypothetical protein
MAKKTPPKKPATKPDPDDETEDQTEDQEETDEDPEEQNRRINAIVTNRVKREMKPLLSQLATLTEAIGKLSKPKDEDQDDSDETDSETTTQKEVKIDPKMSRKMSKLERELAEERDARKKAEQAQIDAQNKTKHNEMLSQFESALAEHGVTDPKLRRAALRLLEEDGVMIRDEESGKIKFKGQDKYGIETLYDPKVGIKSWVLGEGKSFVPAIDASGSGTGGAKSIGNSKLTQGEYGKLSPQQKASIELERASMGLPPLGQD